MRRPLILLTALTAVLWVWPEQQAPPDPAPVVEHEPLRASTIRTGVEQLERAPQAEDIDDLIAALEAEDPLIGLGYVDGIEPLALAHAEIHVVDEDGWPVPWAYVDGGACGGGTTGHEGLMVRVVADPGWCSFTARRRDGLLVTLSDPLDVWLEEDGTAVVELVLPSERTGGLGVAFEPVADGMLVVQVHPDTPADDMGLMEGDLIVAVDGYETSELTTDDFVDLMTGPVGSEVDFVVGWEGDSGWMEEPLVLERALLGG